MNRLAISLFAVLFTLNISAQDKLDAIGSGLETLFYRIADTIPAGQKLAANDSIRHLVEEYVSYDTIFNHRFEYLRFLGQITSPDSLVKVITWNLPLKKGEGRYFCYFIKKGEKGSKNLVYSLSASYNEKAPTQDTTYSSPNWYGALYYDIRPFQSGSEKCWVVLGLDYGNLMVSRKIIDVIRFDQDNTIGFGKKWFETAEGLKFRVVFEYSSTASMTLRFVSGTTIVFDHLVPFSPAYKGNREYYGPDYSYDSYSYADGKWRFSLNVDARNTER